MTQPANDSFLPVTSDEASTESHLDQSQRLMEALDTVIDSVKGAHKLGNEKKASILSKLVRAHCELVRSQRTSMGLDDKVADPNAGVIVAYLKADETDWEKASLVEIKESKLIPIQEPPESDAS